MKKVEKKEVDEILLKEGLVTCEQLQEAIMMQREKGKDLEEILLLQGIITESDLLRVQGLQLNVPYMMLTQYDIDINVVSSIPEQMARRYTSIAVGTVENKLRVAMKEPLDIYAIDALRMSTKMEIIPILASGKRIEEVIDQVYTSAETKNIVFQVEKQLREEAKRQVAISKIEERGEKSPKIQLVNNILERCISEGASDMHIEPFEQWARVRCRVDGYLQEVTKINKEALNTMTTRIKVLSGLEITEHRLPQDGRMSKTVNGQQVDLRVSILPTIYGEKTVIRFIYGKGKQLQLPEIGFHREDYVKVENLLKNPHGILLLTGPTGSGKSTTLAALLKVLNKETVNIITVEDPVENIIEGINQVAVNTKIDLSFATVLRSILRQDPDIIMIGEMRDAETSSIAIRAAITGHLVLSTLHTNDAASSILRLIDMGTEAYMVGAVVKGVISQRLVRKLCPFCRESHSVTPKEALIYKVPEGIKVYEARGCSNCSHTGYRGRLAIHEVLVIDNNLQEIIARGNISVETIKQVAVERGMRTLRENAYYNVLAGYTTLEEMLRITYGQAGEEITWM